MQTRPANWSSLFSSAHRTEYRFIINGVTYDGDSVQGTPIITKPLLDRPTLGRVCTGGLTVTIYPKAEIPKAANVDAYCRLKSTNGNTVTAWMPQGKYYISSRSGRNPMTLTCLDYMIRAGQTYRDKSRFTQWPATMSAVVNEIASIMSVTLDSRTTIKSGRDYVVSYPNDDILISEVLGMIGAVHGGNWVITESGKLRLVPFTVPKSVPDQVIGLNHSNYKSRGKTETITRVILVDSADNEFTSGDDTGETISVKCDYATQEIVTALCNNIHSSITKGNLNLTNALVASGLVNLSYGTYYNGNINVPNNSIIYGTTYEPYTLEKAYLDPLLELGDTVSFNARDGTLHTVVLQTIEMNCTVACTAKISAGIEDETEEEYPYLTAQELTLQRTVKTDQTYFGNSITRGEGFVSKLLVNGKEKAKLTANASVFSMQSYDDNNGWIDRIYFDTRTGKYTITADVTINGVVTFTDLSTSGSTIINGDNIRTGTISASRVDLSSYSTTAEITNMIDGLQLSVKTRESGQQTISTITLSKEGVEISDARVIGTTAQQAATITNSAINGIRLNVTNKDKSSTLTLTAGGVELSSGTITFTGFVTFTDLSGNGTTTINGGNIKTGTISASRVDLSSYSTTAEITNMMGGLQLSVRSSSSGNQTTSTISLNNGTAAIAVTGTTATQAANIAADAVNGISMSVQNGSNSSTLTLTANGTTLSSKTITFTGMVTFSDLSGSGTTTINGSNIKTGTIDASKVTVTNLNASNITSGTISADHIDTSTMKVKTVYSPSNTTAITSSSSTLYVGGSSGSQTFSYLYLMCTNEIRFNFVGTGSALLMNYSESVFQPGTRSSSWMLGTAAYKWYRAYAQQFFGDSGTITTLKATTLNATTLKATSLETSSITGISSLTLTGTLTAKTLYFASGSYSLSSSRCDFPAVSASSLSTSGNVSCSGSLSCSGGATLRGSYSQIRIGSSSDYISFFGRTPTSRPVISTTRISDDTIKTAVVEIINALFNLGLASSS